jgi:hypothetical protein
MLKKKLNKLPALFQQPPLKLKAGECEAYNEACCLALILILPTYHDRLVIMKKAHKDAKNCHGIYWD